MMYNILIENSIGGETKMIDYNKIIFKDYKCFKEETIISDIKPLNIIIGKNNIGKSSILDIIELVYDNAKLIIYENVSIAIEKVISEDDISSICQRGTRGGVFKNNRMVGYSTLDNFETGLHYVGQNIVVNLKVKKEISSYKHETYYTEYKTLYEDQKKFNDIYNEDESRFYSLLSQKIKFKSKTVKRIFAERNILPEIETSSMNVSGYGDGVTTVINNVLNKSIYDEKLVKIDLLNKLNEIMGDDAHFIEIVTQQIEIDGFLKWEVFLRENKKGRIALSKSGSGLKTILIVLVFTILLPHIENASNLHDYIFLFEELENNLHPSLERRLLKFLMELAESGCTIFLTTHSNTLLDFQQVCEEVQIYNVLKDNNITFIKKLDNLLSKHNCLNDLGIKASDILQSNGVIWVEGPSDRIYLNKWIEIWSNGKYKEGFDYTCVFYGGRLLSNITFDEESTENLIQLMLINKNSIIVIDSDKRSINDKINVTKKRLKNEFEKNNQICFITKGREIENYIPSNIFIKHYNLKDEVSIKPYEDIKDFLNMIKNNEGTKFERNKVVYSRIFSELMNINNLKSNMDLDYYMIKIIDQIKIWNSK